MSSLAPRPQPVLLVKGEAGDLDDVMQVMASAFPPEYGEAWTRSQCAGILPMSGVALTLAREADSGRAHGFTLVRTIAGEAELLLIGVAREAQRQGVGRALMDDFVRQAEGQSATRLHLEVRDGNRAIGLYQAAGFRLAGRRRDYYRGRSGHLFDALTLVREACQA